jgi:hypothetical protein
MSAVGFRAQLSGANLWDLVQMKCLARSRQVVQVTGEGGMGLLFLAEGRIIHATTVRQTGEAAALEILGWTNGSFQTCERPWPKAGTINTPCEALLLQVATRWDARSAAAASNLVAFPARTLQDIEVTEIEEEGADMRTTNIESPPPVGPAARAEAEADPGVMLRIGPNGAIVKNSGGSEEVAEALAYANRLVHLVGELLGLDAFSAMECTFGQGEGHWFVFTEKNGDMVALRPRSEGNLQPLRDRLGL